MIRVVILFPPYPHFLPGGDNVKPGIRHQVQVAGHKGPALLTAEAISRIYDCTRGLPHLINWVCSMFEVRFFLVQVINNSRPMSPNHSAA